MLRGEPVAINGDGETSRDFCYVDNVVQANLLAAIADDAAAIGQVYNVAVGGRTSLNELVRACCASSSQRTASRARRRRRPSTRISAPGDVRHSQADIGKAQRLLGYAPTHDVARGLREALPWYEARVPRRVQRVTGAHARQRR